MLDVLLPVQFPKSTSLWALWLTDDRGQPPGSNQAKNLLSRTNNWSNSDQNTKVWKGIFHPFICFVKKILLQIIKSPKWAYLSIIINNNYFAQCTTNWNQLLTLCQSRFYYFIVTIKIILSIFTSALSLNTFKETNTEKLSKVVDKLFFQIISCTSWLKPKCKETNIF